MTVYPLLIAIFFANAVIGVVALQRLHFMGRGPLERISTAFLIIFTMLVTLSALTNYYSWSSYGHWPDVGLGLAVFFRLCLKLRHREDSYPIRYSPPRHITQ